MQTAAKQKSDQFFQSDLQVIVKIVDYELKPGQSHSGVWHVEGMSHERIMATALYILDKDDRIEGGDLLFKRGCTELENEDWCMAFPQGHHYAEEYCQYFPMGRLDLPKGTLAVWPNSHIHRVTNMHHVNSEGSSAVPNTNTPAGKQPATAKTNKFLSWICGTCTYENTNPDFLACEMCGAPRDILKVAVSQANENDRVFHFEMFEFKYF